MWVTNDDGLFLVLIVLVPAMERSNNCPRLMSMSCQSEAEPLGVGVGTYG